MNLINRILRPINLQIRKLHPPISRENALKLREARELYLDSSNRFDMYGEELRDDSGDHPEGVEEQQARFASRCLAGLNFGHLLDIGSMRQWVIGLSACMPVTSIDVRTREPATQNEHVVTSDAKTLPFDNNSFDVVVSMYTIAHVGLGRYGDAFDQDGDIKVFSEIRRVLRVGGHVIFSVPLTIASKPFVYYNMRRYYTYESIMCDFSAGFDTVSEQFFSYYKKSCVPKEKIVINSSEPIEWQYNMYFGSWQKRE